MNLELLPNSLAICRLDSGALIPNWATGKFVSITRTTEEFAVVCAHENVPEDLQAERGWKCFRVAEKLDFSMVGVIAGLTTVLAEAGISVFVVSSYDTDFVLVREADMEKVAEALRNAGHPTIR